MVDNRKILTRLYAATLVLVVSMIFGWYFNQVGTLLMTGFLSTVLLGEVILMSKK